MRGYSFQFFSVIALPAALVVALLWLPQPGDRRVQEIAADLQAKFQVTIHLLGGVEKTYVNGAAPLEREDLESALGTLCNPNKLVWYRDNTESYGVLTRQHYQKSILCSYMPVVLRLQVLPAEFVADILCAFPRKRTAIVGDNRTNKLIVTGPSNPAATIKWVVGHLDFVLSMILLR